MGSVEVGQGMRFAAPGLAFFALNKVLLAILNGLCWMRAFAVGQGLRFVVLIAYVAGAAYREVPGIWLGAAFTVAEMALLLVLVPIVTAALQPTLAMLDRRWLRRHAAFGLKGFLSGVIMETNARVDVLMLGVFLPDRSVGIYSFASMLAEGFYNLLTVVRNNVNPVLVALLRDGNSGEIRQLVRKVQRYVYPAIGAAALLMLGLYPPAVALFLEGSDFMESWPVLAILAAGIFLCSGYVPFNAILVQAGQPGYHTLLTGTIVITNIVLNLALIPSLGIYGAAFGTAISLGMSVVYLNLMVSRQLGFWLSIPFG